MPQTYDPKKVTVIVNGVTLTGYASDSVITATRNEDSVLPAVGIHGDVAYAINNNRSGNIAMNFMSTSPSLRYLRSLAQRNTPVALTITDANTDVDDVQISAEGCQVIKVADVNRTREVGSVAVNIHVPELTYND